MFRRKRALLLAGTTIILCLALIVGGTYALFTDEERVGVHLQAGDLDVDFYRTDVLGCYVDPDTGLIKEIHGGEIDFSEPEGDDLSLFDGILADGESLLIAPTCHFTAKMKIVNNGNVAFNYVVGFEDIANENAALAEQLKVTLTIGGTPIFENVSLKDVLEQQYANNVAIQTCDGFDSEEIVVTVVFVDAGEDNNAAQSEGAELAISEFDIYVVATQVTETIHGIETLAP